jgi:hypothetical protein
MRRVLLASAAMMLALAVSAAAQDYGGDHHHHRRDRQQNSTQQQDNSGSDQGSNSPPSIQSLEQQIETLDTELQSLENELSAGSGAASSSAPAEQPNPLPVPPAAPTQPAAPPSTPVPPPPPSSASTATSSSQQSSSAASSTTSSSPSAAPVTPAPAATSALAASEQAPMVTGTSAAACGAAPVGQAASDVAAAGFNTCAIYYDWTYGIPNNVGSGLPTNWLDCSQNGGDTPNADWTWGENWFEDGVTTPCASGGNSSNSMVYEDTDSGGGGNMALHIHNTAAQMAANNGNQWLLGTGPFTQNEPNDDANLGQVAPWNFPLGVYVEIDWRDTGVDVGGYGNGPAFWTFNYSGYGQGSQCDLELDFDEVQSTSWGAYNFHVCGGPSVGTYGYNASLTSYTTYGYLLTNNGNNQIIACYYVNGTRNGCFNVTTSDAEGLIYGRMPFWWAASYSCGGGCAGDEDTWIAYIKVYTCSNWLVQGNPAESSCSGSALDPTGSFYVASSQTAATQ